MITRGHYIGQLVDDFSQLEGRINFLTQLGLLDLNKYCEDFMRDVLNTLYGYQLQNLNEFRSNTPGLDLGDTKNRIAFQITSTSTSTKIKDTLLAITKEQLGQYDRFVVLILGKKQRTYDAVGDELKTKCKFSTETDIVDLYTLCQKLVTAPQPILDSLQQLVARQLRIVLTEMEPPTEKGEYETTYAHTIDIAPDTICQDGKLLTSKYPRVRLAELQQVFRKLTKIPRITRDFLATFIEAMPDAEDGFYKATFPWLVRKLSIPKEVIVQELQILHDFDFLSDVDVDDKTVTDRFGDSLRAVIEYGLETSQLRPLIVSLDFTRLDAAPADTAA